MARGLGAFASAVLTLALFAACLGVAAIRILGMGTYVVTGGSMEPTIHKGSLAIVEPVSPRTVRVGDVITFDHYAQVTTHRVIAVDATDPSDPVFTTRGDANQAADPEPIHFPAQVGLFRASVPVIGYVVAYAQAYWRITLTAIAGLIFFGCGAMLLFRKEKALTGGRAGPPVNRIDTEQLWASHMGWLREQMARRASAA